VVKKHQKAGEIVKGILTEEEKIKVKQNKAWIKKKGYNRICQTVYILAGKNRGEQHKYGRRTRKR